MRKKRTTASDRGRGDGFVWLSLTRSLSGIMLNGLGPRTNKAASQLPRTLPTDPFRCVQNGHLANSIGSEPRVAFGQSLQWEGGNMTLDTRTHAHMQTRAHTHTHRTDCTNTHTHRHTHISYTHTHTLTEQTVQTHTHTHTHMHTHTHTEQTVQTQTHTCDHPQST